MIAGVFRRVFGTFLEGAILHAKFVTTGTGTAVTFALKSSTSGANYRGLSLTRTGIGLYTLSLVGGARQLAMLGDGLILTNTAGLIGGSFAPTGQAAVSVGGNTATVAIQSIANNGATADTITAGDEVHFCLYVGK